MMNDFETTINTLEQLKGKLIEEHLIDILTNENKDSRYTIAINNAISAINKQVSMDVEVDPYFYGENYHCPHCRKHIGADYNNLKDLNYCNRCGQKITMKKQ